MIREISRREMLRLGTALPVAVKLAQAAPATVEDRGDRVVAKGEPYVFEWQRANDAFAVKDALGRTITTGTLQPAVVVQALRGGARRCSPGTVSAVSVAGSRLAVAYAGVNGWGRLTVTLVFDERGFWMEPVEYVSDAPEDVVSLHYFAQGAGESAGPALQCSHYCIPGISMSSGIGPLVPDFLNLDLTVWLGHGGASSRGVVFQQWALPSHFYCGFRRNTPSFNEADGLGKRLSHTFCLGLAELPAGDLFLQLRGGLSSPLIDYRSDLWGHVRGPGRFTLGAKWRWSFGDDYREAIRAYYAELAAAGIVKRKTASEKKAAAILAPQFNTWGAEVAQGREWNKFNQKDLESFYRGMKDAGMNASMFVFDAKWEGRYGKLEHSQERFPGFVEFLEKRRAEGYKIGMWAAFLRCEDPADLGLTTEHLIRGKDGKPYPYREYEITYYLLDLTQERVQQVIADVARKFVERYKPDLVKFDFGYELPGVSVAAPKEMSLAGERILHKGVQVVVEAMREANPDIAIMYYSLSPLFADYFDLHSPDDLFGCQGEYDLEANRRYFFSSLLGELGIPTYGSGGYDWRTMNEIWFDSAAVGTLGSLLSFAGDEAGDGPASSAVAKFNGVRNLLRGSIRYRAEAVEWARLGPVRAARSASWARWEGEKLTLVALRKGNYNGGVASGRYKEAVEATAQVVLASKTGEDIRKSNHLGIAPFGDGSVTWKTDVTAKAVEVTEYLFGGKKRTHKVKAAAGQCRIAFQERDARGTPVEWLEVRLV